MTLEACLARHFAHAALRLRLDEELGNWHGLSWNDYVLLAVLDADGALATAQLAARVGLKPSALVLQLLPLEKTGLVAREAGPDGKRRVVLQAGGRRLVREARSTAEAACAEG